MSIRKAGPELGVYGNLVIRESVIFRFSDLNRTSHHPSVLTQTGNDVNCGGRRATCSQFGWLTMARVATCAGNVVGCRSSQGRQETDVPDQVDPTSDLLGALGAAPYRPYRRHTGQPRLGFPQGCLTPRRRQMPRRPAVRVQDRYLSAGLTLFLDTNKINGRTILRSDHSTAWTPETRR